MRPTFDRARPGAAGRSGKPPDSGAATPWRWMLAHPLVALLLATSLVVLLVHAWSYWFLTDDAFISFRYARNLAQGHGLVFNPGYERVEGYTNFLWVLILAAVHRAGLPIEHAANPLSIAATVVLWALVVREALRRPPEARTAWLVLIPAFALALTRSVAVWSTSGLETRLFELLIVAAAFRLPREIAAILQGRTPAPWAGVMFGLAEWTRPDGLLVAAGAYGAAGVYLLAIRRVEARRFALAIAPCALLIGAHFAFRTGYYGEMFPNTYYAKVDGRLWWRAGLKYVEAFMLEYGLYLWIPMLIAGAMRLVRERRALVVLVIAGVTLPHVLYVTAIGGDHFEYRPLDLVFPFAALLLYDGARSIVGTRLGARVLPAYLVIVAIGLWEIPFQSHRQMPADYQPGFPGGASGTRAGREFLAPHRDPIFRLPGLSSIAERHRRLVAWCTDHFSAIRQEEHRQFLASVRPAAHALRRLVDGGRVPRDLYLAMPCVGVIPYDSDVRTLDLLGLTDAQVAHGPFTQRLRLAHDKYATDDYVRSRSVDLVAETRPIVDVASEDFLVPLRLSVEKGEPFVAAAIEPRLYLVGRALAGPDRVERRLPRLDFEPMSDSSFFERTIAAAIGRYRERPSSALAGHLALALASRGRNEEALALLEDALARAPDDAGLWVRIARCRAALGNHGEARTALARAVAIGVGRDDQKWVRRTEALLDSLSAPSDH